MLTLRNPRSRSAFSLGRHSAGVPAMAKRPMISGPTSESNSAGYETSGSKYHPVACDASSLIRSNSGVGKSERSAPPKDR